MEKGLEVMLGLIGAGVLLGLAFYGWPKLITINHYHGSKRDK